VGRSFLLVSFALILLNKYCLCNKIMLNEMGRACDTCGEKRNAYGALEGNLDRKRPLGRPRPR
jgi:hypothetical protein